MSDSTQFTPFNPVGALDELMVAARELRDRVAFNRVCWPEAKRVANAIEAYDNGVQRVADAICGEPCSGGCGKIIAAAYCQDCEITNV